VHQLQQLKKKSNWPQNKLAGGSLEAVQEVGNQVVYLILRRTRIDFQIYRQVVEVARIAEVARLE
jgi:hypothetical protein